MYREFREKRASRSRSRDRRTTGDPDLDSVLRAQREGNVQFQKQTTTSKMDLDLTLGDGISVEENSFDLAFKRGSSKKSCRTPIKKLIDKEISNEMEIRRSSPSLVARLMGLDTLPPVVSRHQKERSVSSRKTSSVELHKKHIGHEADHLRTSSNEYQECKDVFEVMEMPKVDKHSSKPFHKGIPSLGRNEIKLEPSNIELAFAKKFMDAAHLPTHDELLYSEEYDDALEDLDPNKDLFVRLLQDPNSLFKKHFQDLKCSPPSPHANHITILKPSKAARADNDMCSRSERNVERHHHLLKEDISSCRKPVYNLVDYSVKEHSTSQRCELFEPSYAGKTKVHREPTQIVVLKPSLDKVWDTETTVPLSRSTDNYEYVLNREKGISMSRKSEVYAGQGDRRKLSDSVEATRHKTKGLREIARDITRQLRTSGSSGSQAVRGLKKYDYNRDEGTRGILSMEKLNSESFQWPYGQLNDCGDRLSTPSYYSNDSSVSREARKRLSERWKMIQQIHGLRPVDKGSNTLGEMLVSERKTPRSTLNRSVNQNASGEVSSREAVLQWNCPLSISNKDGLAHRWPRNLSRSTSLPSSSSGYHKTSKRDRVGISDNICLHNVLDKSLNDPLVRNGSHIRKPSTQTLKYNHTKPQMYPGREEGEIFEREIHVNSEELHSRVHVRDRTGVDGMCAETSNDSVAGRGQEGTELVPQRKVAPLTVDDQQVQRSTELAVPVNDGEHFGADSDLTKMETSSNNPQVSPIPSKCVIAESASPISFKEDQPSPISVLDLPPSEEDKSSSECFEKISADLKELRMQLKLLKLESAGTDAEDLELLISSDEEDIRGHAHSPLNSVEILEEFRDDEERDFSYLVDVLIDSGVHSTSGDGLLNACCMLEYPVGRGAFEKLEKKYNALASWSRSERKLLFDLICSIIAQTIAPSIAPQSMKSRSRHRWARESLVEDVWQLVVKQRNEIGVQLEEKLLLEPRWLDLGDDINIVGTELEQMLMDDLTNELLSQL